VQKREILAEDGPADDSETPHADGEGAPAPTSS